MLIFHERTSYHNSRVVPTCGIITYYSSLTVRQLRTWDREVLRMYNYKEGGKSWCQRILGYLSKLRVELLPRYLGARGLAENLIQLNFAVC